MTDCELFDFNALAEAKETMQSKFGTMIEYFIEDSESYITAIRTAMAAGSIEGIISPSHTLKSSSRQMGALRVSNIAMEMEALSREMSSAGRRDVAPFQPLVEKLEAAFHETRQALPAQAA